MLNCHQATRLLSEAQDRKLKVTEQIELKFHLLMCSGCRNFSQQMGSLRHFMQEFARQPEDQQQSDADKADKPGHDKRD